MSPNLTGGLGMINTPFLGEKPAIYDTFAGFVVIRLFFRQAGARVCQPAHFADRQVVRRFLFWLVQFVFSFLGAPEERRAGVRFYI